ncbi:hypothetical protein A2U01_0097863, partial [Trifolium medium]|nr:hypothetical protein [Trifolium medium]
MLSRLRWLPWATTKRKASAATATARANAATTTSYSGVSTADGGSNWSV